MDKKLVMKYLSAFMLGDGCLRMFKGGINAAYSFGQIDKHEEYTLFQKSIIEQVTGSTLRHYASKQSNDGVNHQAYFKLESRCHPTFTTLRERWYSDGRKTISLHDLKQFDWEMMAIWYMDDGYILNSSYKGHDGNVFLCTDNFNEVEVTMLQKIIFTSLGISMDIIKRGHKKDGTRIFRLRVKHGRQAEAFCAGVKPFMFDSFKYKLRMKDPEISGGDIVCSSGKLEEVSGNDLPL